MGNSTAKIKHKSSSFIHIKSSLPPENLVIPSRDIYLYKGEALGNKKGFGVRDRDSELIF